MSYYPRDHNVNVYVPRGISTVFHYDADPLTQRTYTVFLFQQTVHRVLTIVTRSSDVITRWLQMVLNFHRHPYQRLIVGMGVQWNRRPPTNRRQAATLQLCVGTYCLIIQLNYLRDVPDLLRNFLRDPRHILVGVWNYIDKLMLWESRHSLAVDRLVDLFHVAVEQGRFSSTPITMQRLVEVVLGFQFRYQNEVKPPWVGNSKWDEYWLSLEQVQYACVDAFVSFLMGVELRVWNQGQLLCNGIGN